MGNSLSGTLATFVLDDMLNENIGQDKPKLIKKYIDNFLIIDSDDSIEGLFRKLNECHKTIKFTIEKEVNKKLPFLDILLERKNGRLITDWYQKNISSGRLLNWLSAHPYKMKFNIGLSFANRVLKLSDSQYHPKNYKIIKNILIKNNFPENIARRIINQSKNYKPKDNNNNLYPIFRSLPYVAGLTDAITKNVQDIVPNIKFESKPLNKLRSTVFTNTKTKYKKQRQGHVYKINCKGKLNEPCNVNYIGESGR